MTWLTRLASDEERLKRNLERLEELRKSVHDLSYYGIACQSGGFKVLQDILDNRVVRGHPQLEQKLKQALIGENNQKVVLDAPTRFQRLLLEAEEYIIRQVAKEKRELRKISD